MAKTKEYIRKEILSRLRKHPEEERKRKSGIIRDKLFASGEYKKAHAVMFYLSRDEEVATRRMIEEAIKSGKKVALPRCETETKEIVAAELKKAWKGLELGPYGIYQPKKDTSAEIPLEKIDLVIVPGVAFDDKFSRLGRGKGYYDRFLKKLPPGTKTIGLCFDFQRVKSLPAKSHDFPVSKVISN